MLRYRFNKAEDDEEEKDVEVEEEEGGKPGPDADWEEIAIWELGQENNDEYEKKRDIRKFNGIEVKSGKEEWMIFEDSDEAERYAVDLVKDDLMDDPDMFNASFIESHIYMSDTYKRVTANDLADSQTSDMDDDDVISTCESMGISLPDEPDDWDEEENGEWEATADNLTSDQIDSLRDDLNSKMVDDIADELDDPIQYFIHDQGLYSNVKELLDNNVVSIDYDAAAQEAVDTDGVAHFLARYNGEETELPSGAVAYRTN